MLYRIFRFLLILIFKVFFHIKVSGRNHIPKKGGFILASNHLSYLDPIVLGIGCPRKLNFMARHDLFLNPLFSWLISTLGAFPVKRNSADISAMKEAIRRLRNGNALLLFPEGSRKSEGEALQVQPGIGFLTSKVSVPVIPAFVKGTDEAMPKHSKAIRFKQVSVCFGKEIPVARGLPYQDVALNIMEGIKQLSKNYL